MQIAAGTWAGGHEQRATQYYNVVGELTGSRIVKGFVCIITIISLVCTGIAQLVAMSTGSYYLNTSVDKRCERKLRNSESKSALELQQQSFLAEKNVCILYYSMNNCIQAH